MAQFYEMPAISPTMETGTLVAWRVKEGEAFQSSAVIAEVGTDKANMDAEIFDAGVMLKHLIAEGDEVPPGHPIAIVGQAGEDISGLLAEFDKRRAAAPAPPASPPAAAADADRPQPVAEVAAAPPPRPEPSTPKRPERTVSGTVERQWMGKPIHHLFADPPGDVQFGANGAGGHVAASPLARKVAAERGIDLHRVQGSGPGGRIAVADLDNHLRGGSAPLAPPAVQTRGGPSLAPREDEAVRNSPMRKTIARRLLESHQNIPTFFLTAALDGQGFVHLREALKKKNPELKASYNDLLVMCVARALREHPQVNASWGDKEIVRHGRVDIGIAVALPDGLITPVLRAADRMSLDEIASQTRALAGRAREQRLAPEEYTGGTFTISNLGMFGIEHFTAIINPPESAILAVGALEQVPVVHGGAIEPGWRMNVTMTCDHRVIDGATGAQFLQTLRSYVENPALMLF